MWKRIAQRPGLGQIPEIGEGATYLRKWGLIGILIGVGAGLGALALMWCINLVKHFVLGTMVGYIPPLPGGEGGMSQYSFHMSRPWMLPLVTTAAGLVGGFLTWKLAPQTAGIGTNAAIRAFHNSEKLNFKTSIFKLITSAITIGGGLTSGREGPIAQIGAPPEPVLPTSLNSLRGNGTLPWLQGWAPASPRSLRRRWPGPSLPRRFFTRRISKSRPWCP